MARVVKPFFVGGLVSGNVTATCSVTMASPTLTAEATVVAAGEPEIFLTFVGADGFAASSNYGMSETYIPETRPAEVTNADAQYSPQLTLYQGSPLQGSATRRYLRAGGEIHTVAGAHTTMMGSATVGGGWTREIAAGDYPTFGGSEMTPGLNAYNDVIAVTKRADIFHISGTQQVTITDYFPSLPLPYAPVGGLFSYRQVKGPVGKYFLLGSDDGEGNLTFTQIDFTGEWQRAEHYWSRATSGNMSWVIRVPMQGAFDFQVAYPANSIGGSENPDSQSVWYGNVAALHETFGLEVGSSAYNEWPYARERTGVPAGIAQTLATGLYVPSTRTEDEDEELVGVVWQPATVHEVTGVHLAGIFGAADQPSGAAWAMRWIHPWSGALPADDVLWIELEAEDGNAIVAGGTWADATAYALGDVVTVGPLNYVCWWAHTSAAATEPGVGADWRTRWHDVPAITRGYFRADPDCDADPVTGARMYRARIPINGDWREFMRLSGNGVTFTMREGHDSASALTFAEGAQGITVEGYSEQRHAFNQCPARVLARAQATPAARRFTPPTKVQVNATIDVVNRTEGTMGWRCSFFRDPKAGDGDGVVSADLIQTGPYGGADNSKVVQFEGAGEAGVVRLQGGMSNQHDPNNPEWDPSLQGNDTTWYVIQIPEGLFRERLEFDLWERWSGRKFQDVYIAIGDLEVWIDPTMTEIPGVPGSTVSFTDTVDDPLYNHTYQIIGPCTLMADRDHTRYFHGHLQAFYARRSMLTREQVAAKIATLGPRRDHLLMGWSTPDILGPQTFPGGVIDPTVGTPRWSTANIGNGTVVVDASARSGYAVEFPWLASPGAEENQYVRGITTDRTVLHAAWRQKYDTAWDFTRSDLLKKVARFQTAAFGNYGSLLLKWGGASEGQTVFVFFGDTWESSTNFTYGTNNGGTLGTRIDPVDCQGVWRDFEVALDFTNPASVVMQFWIDSALQMSYDIAPTAAPTAVPSQVEFGGTFNLPGGAYTDRIDRMALSTTRITPA